MPVLSWKKEKLLVDYDLFLDHKLVGDIRNKPFSGTSYVEIAGKKYFFETEGLRLRTITVINMQNRKQIGSIGFNMMRTKAKIELFGKSYIWKLNIFYTRWTISDRSNQPIIYSKKYRGDSFQVSDHTDEILVLCGIVAMVKIRQFGT